LKACFVGRLEKMEEFEKVKEPGTHGDLGANTMEKVF
jgi:hypothetical protein